jgi:hypothetical protein
MMKAKSVRSFYDFLQRICDGAQTLMRYFAPELRMEEK